MVAIHRVYHGLVQTEPPPHSTVRLLAILDEVPKARRSRDQAGATVDQCHGLLVAVNAGHKSLAGNGNHPPRHVATIGSCFLKLRLWKALMGGLYIHYPMKAMCAKGVQASSTAKPRVRNNNFLLPEIRADKSESRRGRVSPFLVVVFLVHCFLLLH